MIDSHCHIDLPDFDADRADVLHACKIANIEKLLVPGLSIEQFSLLIKLSSNYPQQIDIALGCHPYFLTALSHENAEVLKSNLFELGLTYKDKIVAVGECGLDGSLALSMAYQEKILAWHIDLASNIKKPLVLHHRQSHNQLIRLLKLKRYTLGGVIHAFSGSENIAKTYVDMGFKLGVGGTITYPRAEKTIATIKKLSLEHLLIETDSPDMPIKGFQGQRNSPLQTIAVAKALAQLKGISVEEVEKQSTENYYRLFSKTT
ncbi:TatD family hydrolase [Glaciecola petra]|uniref:TatD family hydrolase n=1 Tax=Glaciecola petra TaxID=3075602 RepID=A0ABU2ZW43_9ALTE|nr:TatD family hydrolase [Aestuariibacter sp. P117]MDT0595804.1 TatD family hydrolase [Aestuariibacter sp. P117]